MDSFLFFSSIGSWLLPLRTIALPGHSYRRHFITLLSQLVHTCTALPPFSSRSRLPHCMHCTAHCQNKWSLARTLSSSVAFAGPLFLGRRGGGEGYLGSEIPLRTISQQRNKTRKSKWKPTTINTKIVALAAESLMFSGARRDTFAFFLLPKPPEPEACTQQQMPIHTHARAGPQPP